MKKLISRITATGNLYSLLASMVFSLFGFGTFLILVRHVSNEVFGSWILFITISSLIDMLRLGLTGTAAIKLISEGKASENEVSAASYQLGACATALVVIVFYGLFFIIRNLAPGNVYLPVLMFYPLLSVVNLPYNQALIKFQGKVDFLKVFGLRLAGGLLSFVFVAGYVVYFGKDFQGLLVAYIFANLLTSLLVSMLNWDGIRHILTPCRTVRNEILRFGKYSTAGYIGSNLLRSADTLLLSLFPFMGARAISIFAVPFKFVEVVEIPLRSFTATAFPRLSKALKDGFPAFNRMLFEYIFWTTLLLLPCILVILIFPGFFLSILGGNSFPESRIVQEHILLVVCIYILVLPVDRYSGVALFAMDKPALNFFKILFMLAANVFFDLIAIMVFKSLVGVAVATLIFTILGIFQGWYYLFREQNMSLRIALRNTRLRYGGYFRRKNFGRIWTNIMK